MEKFMTKEFAPGLALDTGEFIPARDLNAQTAAPQVQTSATKGSRTGDSEMTDKKQPEALRLAALIEKTGARGSLRDQAAVERRRLHAENETLRTGYEAARLEIESLRAAQPEAQPGAAYDCCNTWFCSLPEGRQAVLRDDKWMLAHAAFEAGRASHWQAQSKTAPVDAIASILNEVMEIAVSNGANSVSMPDNYVEVAAWLAAAPTTQPEPQLPERDASVPAEQQGLFRKFDVRRVDGSDQPGGKHHGCRYFILDVDHDQHAHDALTAYAAACESSHPELAADLRTKWGAASPTTPPAPAAQSFESDGWLHENGLLYRLTDERYPTNRDEINVTMADGSRSIESRSRRALELLNRIRRS